MPSRFTFYLAALRVLFLMVCVIITKSDGIFWIITWFEDNLSSFNYFREIALTTCLRKSTRGRDSSSSSLLTQYNTLTPWRSIYTIQTNGDQHNFFIWIPILIWPCSCPFCWRNPCFGCNTEIDLVVVLEYTSFNFVQKLCNPPCCLFNHSYTAFLLDVRCLKWPRSILFAAIYHHESAFA